VSPFFGREVPVLERQEGMDCREAAPILERGKL
jgi:hypothetical protein